MSNELYHHGVLGQKWGVRRYETASGHLTAAGKKRYGTSDIKQKVSDTKAAYKSAKKQYNKDFDSMYKQASNRPIYTNFTSKGKKEYADKMERVSKSMSQMVDAKQNYKTAKKERNTAIKNTYKDLNKKASLGEKLTYNNATRKKAAKYIVDNNMSVADATKKAKGDAWRNAAALTGVYGGITLAAIYKMNH